VTDELRKRALRIIRKNASKQDTWEMLLELGFGPDIGVGFACAFSARGFTHIALMPRNKERLAKDQNKALNGVQKRGYSRQEMTWASDIADLNVLKVQA